jgi:small subunit ribosomal protein S16
LRENGVSESLLVRNSTFVIRNSDPLPHKTDPNTTSKFQISAKETFVAVRLRLKKMGRKHRPFFRICAMDARTPRDGRAIEELGHYDPLVQDTDARAILNGERIAYWLGVGALPTDKVGVLIKKYGANGTHLEKQKAALEQLSRKRPAPMVAVGARASSSDADESDDAGDDGAEESSE